MLQLLQNLQLSFDLKPDHHMANNLLQIQPYNNKFYDVVIDNLIRTFAQVEDVNLLQIEFKYARLKYFHMNFNQHQFRELPQALRRKVEDMMLRQTEQFLQSLKVMSNQTVIYMNPLGKHKYGLVSGFLEFQNKKFYHIRDLFTKIGIYTESTNYKRHEPKKQPVNIYQQFVNSNNNHLLRMIDQNEIRLDLYIKEIGSPQLQGRYSYTSNDGWKKTVKEPLCQQMDYAFGEQLFRMAVNRQVEEAVPQKDMEQIAKICKTATKAFDIRLKRQMRVQKGEIFQFTFSEVYNISDLKICSDLANLMSQSQDVFDRFIRKLFINFFSIAEKERNTLAFEIQLQLTKNMNRRLKHLLAERKIDEVKRELMSVVEELLVIYHADHATKVKEQIWMNYLVPKYVTQGRLENQYGTHMRERLYRLMEENVDPMIRRQPSSQNLFRQ